MNVRILKLLFRLWDLMLVSRLFESFQVVVMAAFSPVSLRMLSPLFHYDITEDETYHTPGTGDGESKPQIYGYIR
jgi:hypothetical protein